MNERIAKLYDQAIVVEDSGDFVTGELDPVKFAELIVKECAEICDAYGMPDSTSQTAMVLSRAIKKHFGVEPPRSLLCPKCGTDRIKSACPRGYGAAVDGSCPMVFKAQ